MITILRIKKNSGSATLDILPVLQSLATKLRNGFLWEALRHLVLFAQFNKREKHSWRSVTFSKVVGFSLPATLLKATLLHGCFSRFLNCTNGSKLRKASHIILKKNFKNRTIKCTAQKTSIFGVFLVRIVPHPDWIRRDTLHLYKFILNAGKYGPEKLRIRTFFTQWRYAEAYLGLF